MNATFSDLRARTGEILEAVDRGETVHIFCRGKERAVLMPPAKPARSRRSSADHPACGMWADRRDMEDVHAWLRKIWEPRHRSLRWGHPPRRRKHQALPAY